MKTFVVDIAAPFDKLSDRKLAAHIKDAVGSWSGQFRPPGTYSDEDPGDELWGLTHRHVKVRRAK